MRLNICWIATAVLSAASLAPDQLKLLQDPGGWEYVKMTSGGIQTEHVCFDGKLHPDICSGRLTLSADNKFVQEVAIQGQHVGRHGTYTLENGELTFFDEFANPDGPYTVELDGAKKTLTIFTSQVRIELVLEKSLRPRKRKGDK